MYTLIATVLLGTVAPLALESPAGAYALALGDLKTLPGPLRAQTRYLALWAVPRADRPDFVRVLSAWTGSITYRRKPPQLRIVGDGLLIRLNLVDYEWDRSSRYLRRAEMSRLGVAFAVGEISDDPWETLGAKDPYFKVNGLVSKPGTYEQVLVRGWLDPTIEAAVRQMTYSAHAVLRADWFLVHTSTDRPNGSYSDFLMLPAREADLYKLLLIDERSVRLQAISLGGATAASVSIVALNPREIELLRGEHGDLWRTYDFDSRNVLIDAAGRKNPRRSFRGTVQHDGREIIWELPSGLHAYRLSNGAGEQVDVVPPTIAQDQRPAPGIRERTVVNAWKCVDCHWPRSGLNDFDDAITTQMNTPSSGLLTYVDAAYGHATPADVAAVLRERRRIEDYYNENYRPRMEADKASFGAALKRLTGWDGPTAARALVDAVQRYAYDPVGKPRALRECGVYIDEGDAFLKRSADPDLLYLIDDDPSHVRQITRAQFELSYQAAMQGVPAYPWEVRDAVPIPKGASSP